MTRSTIHCAGTITPTRPSTNSVIGMCAADRGTSCRAANPPHSAAADSTVPANTAVARLPRALTGRVCAPWPSSRDGNASTPRRIQSRSAIVTATPLVRKRSAIAAASEEAPSTPSASSSRTAIDIGIVATIASVSPRATTCMSPPGGDTTTNSCAISTTVVNRSCSPSRSASARCNTTQLFATVSAASRTRSTRDDAHHVEQTSTIVSAQPPTTSCMTACHTSATATGHSSINVSSSSTPSIPAQTNSASA